MTKARFGITLLALLAAACSRSETNAGETSYNLPDQLTEVSGLAVAGRDSVFTHNDEYAIIYEYRLSDGQQLRAFALGDPTLEGDFEGIATDQGRVFLVTSDGLIYSMLPGQNGERVQYKVYDSGIGPRCEIEGLSRAPTPGELLLMCKRFRNDTKVPLLEIYRWRIGQENAENEPFLSIPLEGMLEKKERGDFRPSGLEYDAACQQFYIVSARNRLVLVLDATGKLLGKRKFKSSRHPQTEGITVMPDGRLVMTDEGSRTRNARLSIYDNLSITSSCGTP